MSTFRRLPLLGATTALLLVAACTAGSASPSSSASISPAPSTSVAPSPTPTTSPTATPAITPSPPASPSPVTTPAEAAARVLATDPHFAGIGPLLPDLIGQSSWYAVEQGVDGYLVTIRMGWGDCPAGCISSHRWHYTVATDGTVAFVGEDGDPIEGAIPGPDVTGTGDLDIHVVAGPTCPVETVPPQPGCEPSEVVGATVIIRDANGTEVAQTVSDDTGHARAMHLPAGIYVVSAEPLEGYMAAPEPVAVWALSDGPGLATLTYETGIR